MAKAFYLAYGGAETTVFDSQVLDFLERQKDEGIVLRFIAFQELNSWLHERDFITNKKRLIAAASGYEPIFLPRFPRNAFNLNGWALRRVLDGQGPPAVIHARGLQSGAMAAKMKKFFPCLRVLLDHRGVEPEEFLYIIRGEKLRRPNIFDRYWYQHLKKIERRAIMGADYIFCVSHALRDHVAADFPSAIDKIAVVPGCVNLQRFSPNDETRIQMRGKLGLNGHLVMVYAGSLRAWQSPTQIVQVFKEALAMGLKTFLIVLTPHRHLAQGAFEETGIERSLYKILTTNHQTTPQYLAAADIGIAIRDNDVINQVASPTKSGEYLAAGNLILTTPCPADLSAIVKKENAGYVLPYPFNRKHLQEALIKLAHQCREETGLRDRLRQIAGRYYDWKKYQNIVATTYERLIPGGATSS
ncbi:MAG: glycosyltransferase [Elusimicrobia bacterium]|nr:glycosyltransferase [Elusimicrobiota bacterium]